MTEYPVGEPVATKEAPAVFQKLRARWKAIDSMAGVGLDPDPRRIPQEIWDAVGGRDNISEGMFLFNTQIIDATAPWAVAYKINAHFYTDAASRAAFEQTFSYLKKNHPTIVRICDGKFADVAHTSERLAEEIFGRLDADGILLNPYLGRDAITPFLAWPDKAVCLCVKTSNPSASDIQNMIMADGRPLWENVLRMSFEEWNGEGTMMPVLSATAASDLVGIRTIVGDAPILLAGVGTQQGNLKESIPHCLDLEGYGVLVSVSRDILYPRLKQGERVGEASARQIQRLRNGINGIKQETAYARAGESSL